MAMLAAAGLIGTGTLGIGGTTAHGQLLSRAAAAFENLVIGNPRGIANAADALERIEEGRRIFRFDTFGDEVFWAGALRLHEAIAGAGRPAHLRVSHRRRRRLQ